MLRQLSVAAALASGCAGEPVPVPTTPAATPGAPPLDPAVVASLSMARIRDDVGLIASDDQGGRAPGSPGHQFVADWIASEMGAAGLEPVGASFAVDVPLTLERQRLALDAQGQVYPIPLEQVGRDLFGLRPGSDPALADEVVLLVAHYDHLGVTDTGEVYNGAFDDGTAVCALLELARALDAGQVSFPRSVGFLFTDAEEDGLDGAAAWAADPSVPLTDLAAVLSVDPIGRPLLTDYMPLFTIGAERSPEITRALIDTAPFTGAEVRRLSRTPVLLYASDQDVFWNRATPVPSVWITSGGMTWYHTTGDDPETIDYRSVKVHLGAIAQLAAALATASDRPTDVGPQPVSADDLSEAIATVEGALRSPELTDEERLIGEDFRDTLQRGIDSGDPGGGEYVAEYAQLLLYVITELTPAHPGPVPPPFPE